MSRRMLLHGRWSRRANSQDDDAGDPGGARDLVPRPLTQRAGGQMVQNQTRLALTQSIGVAHCGHAGMITAGVVGGATRGANAEGGANGDGGAWGDDGYGDGGA